MKNYIKVIDSENKIEHGNPIMNLKGEIRRALLCHLVENDSKKMIKNVKPIEVWIISDAISITAAIGEQVIMIKRKPHLIIGKAPKNIVNKLISGEKKDGDEVEVKMIVDEYIEPTTMETHIAHREIVLNADGTVKCK